MPLTNEQREQIIPELNAAALHLGSASELLNYLYHDLRKLGKGPRELVSKLIQEVENMKYRLRGNSFDDRRAIIGRLMKGSISDELWGDPVAARKRCRQMFMRDLKTLTKDSFVAHTEVTPPPKKKGKTRKPKKVLSFNRGKSTQRDKD